MFAPKPPMGSSPRGKILNIGQSFPFRPRRVRRSGEKKKAGMDGLPQLKLGRLNLQPDNFPTVRNARHAPHPKPPAKVQQTARAPHRSRFFHNERSSHEKRHTARHRRVPSKPVATQNKAMTVAEAMKLYGSKLSAFEQSEILHHSDIYFVGGEANKIQGIPHAQRNNGYDDSKGDYRTVLHDHIAFRFEVLKVVGRGSFGQVVKVLDHKTNKHLALKLIRNKKRFHHQALVEVKLLQKCMERDPKDECNIVRVYEHFYFRNHLCITFELLSINLYELIKKNKYRGESLELVQSFAVQMVKTLAFLEKENIVHCDMKPENVLMVHPKQTAIKVIDFGSSCYENERVYTYIQSRFYRAPEVILGMPYGKPIDMWSLACILGELYTGFPMFPGEDETEQMQCIMEVFGRPPRHMIVSAKRRRVFFDNNMRELVVPNSRGKVRRANTKDLSTLLKGCRSEQFLSFLRECLKWDPTERLTASAALLHPYIRGTRPSARVRHSQHPRSSGLALHGRAAGSSYFPQLYGRAR